MPTHLLLRSCQGAAAQGTYLPFILLPPFHFPNPSCMEKPKTKHTTVRCHWSSQVPVGLTYPDLLPATSPLAHAQSHPRYVAPSAPLGSGPCHEHLGRRLVLRVSTLWPQLAQAQPTAAYLWCSMSPMSKDVPPWHLLGISPEGQDYRLF